MIINKKTHIVLSIKTKKKLDALVINKSDTYEDIIKRLLNKK